MQCNLQFCQQRFPCPSLDGETVVLVLLQTRIECKFHCKFNLQNPWGIGCSESCRGVCLADDAVLGIGGHCNTSCKLYIIADLFCGNHCKNQHDSCYYSYVVAIVLQECASLAPSTCFQRLHDAIIVATPELTPIQVMTSCDS